MNNSVFRVVSPPIIRKYRGRVGTAAPDDGWKYHSKHVEQFTDINKLCNVASCWIFIGITSSSYLFYFDIVCDSFIKKDMLLGPKWADH